MQQKTQNKKTTCGKTDAATCTDKVRTMQGPSSDDIVYYLFAPGLKTEDLDSLLSYMYRSRSWDVYDEAIRKLYFLALKTGSSRKDAGGMCSAFMRAKKNFIKAMDQREQILGILTPKGMIAFISEAEPDDFVKLCRYVLKYNYHNRFYSAVVQAGIRIKKDEDKQIAALPQEEQDAAIRILDALMNTLKRLEKQKKQDEFLVKLIGT